MPIAARPEMKLRRYYNIILATKVMNLNVNRVETVFVVALCMHILNSVFIYIVWLYKNDTFRNDLKATPSDNQTGRAKNLLWRGLAKGYRCFKSRRYYLAF